jgi:hypothetical protein
MILLPIQTLVYPLLFTNIQFQEWYSGTGLKRTFTYNSKLENNYEYILTCNLQSRFSNNDVYGSCDDFKDYIETELFINDGKNEFFENFQNRINSQKRFNYFSLINSNERDKIKYTLSKNNKIYKTLELINHDQDYLKIRDNIYQICNL